MLRRKSIGSRLVAVALIVAVAGLAALLAFASETAGDGGLVTPVPPLPGSPPTAILVDSGTIGSGECFVSIQKIIEGPLQVDRPVVEGETPPTPFLLREVEVIDDSNNWVGGDTHLVSLGDLIDRGPGSRQVVELLMKLQQQAAAAGGAVHVVLGNHEVLVMSGDTRYISRAEYAAFADDESGAEREALLNSYRESVPELSEEEVEV